MIAWNDVWPVLSDLDAKEPGDDYVSSAIDDEPNVRRSLLLKFPVDLEGLLAGYNYSTERVSGPTHPLHGGTDMGRLQRNIRRNPM